MRVGIIGCGSIVRSRHAVEFSNNSDVTLAGFVGFVPGHAKQLATQYGCSAYESVDAMLADDSIDAVSVCTSNALHAEVSIKALRAGKHVLCEKPMATSLAECEAMLAEAHKAKRRLLIAQNQRMDLAYQKAHDMIASGKLGKVLSFQSMLCHGGPERWGVKTDGDTWFFRKDAAAFGSMADLGVHMVDVLRYLLDDEVRDVYCGMKVLDKRLSDGSPIDVDDNSIAILHFRDGAFGSVTTSWTCYGTFLSQTTLFCQKGVIKINCDPDFPLIVCHDGGQEEKFTFESCENGSGVIDEFVESVTTGRPSILDADRVLGSMKVVFAGARSSQSGRVELCD